MNCEGCSCWKEAEAEELEAAIEAICVERDGKCACEPCRCRNQDVAEEGKW